MSSMMTHSTTIRLWQKTGLLLMGFSTAVVASSKWVYVITDSNGSAVSVDVRSVKHRGSVATFWQKTAKGDGSIRLVFLRIDCERDIWSPLAVQVRNAKGKVTESYTAPEQFSNRPIPPDSVLSAQEALVCR